MSPGRACGWMGNGTGAWVDHGNYPVQAAGTFEGALIYRVGGGGWQQVVLADLNVDTTGTRTGTTIPGPFEWIEFGPNDENLTDNSGALQVYYTDPA